MSFAHGDGHDMPDAIRARNAAFDRFFTAIERKAFRIARLALRDDDDALDAVQDSMMQLVRAYASRPPDEWKPLFYRILANRIRDQQRRRTTRRRVFAWWPTGRATGGAGDYLDGGDTPGIDGPAGNAPSPEPGPERRLELGQSMALLEQYVSQLSEKQQQAFLLRNFEDLDVAQTAKAMGCSEGTVKTHYSRAVHTLRVRLMEAGS